jgi:hypothetical protein
MSAPVREGEGPLSYAPRWARLPGDNRAGANNDDAAAREFRSARKPVPVRELAPEPDMEPDPAPMGDLAPEPPWKRKRKARATFEGDVAIKELRARLALSPDQIPEPPLHSSGSSAVAVVARLMGVLVLAAAGAIGFLWITAPHAVPPDGQTQVGGPAGGQIGSQAASQVAGQVAPQAVDRVSRPVAVVSVRKPELPATTENLKADRTEPPSSRASWSVADFARGYTDGAGAGASPAAPPPPPAPAPRAALPAVETRIAPPAKVPPVSAVAAQDREEVATLLARGRAYFAEGDIAAARLVLRRAVERGDPQAALALGGTYDPIVLKRLGVMNLVADPAQARDWYQKAAELGSADAPLRIEQLAQVDR